MTQFHIVQVNWDGIVKDAVDSVSGALAPYAQGGVISRNGGDRKIAFAWPEDGADLRLICFKCSQPCRVVGETRPDREDRGRYDVVPLPCACQKN